MPDASAPPTRDDLIMRLLAHYQAAGEPDREAWHDRVMAWEGARPVDLTRWHGELLAAAWLEQNTGATVGVAPGRVPACYRVTAAGRQALRRAAAQGADERLAAA